MKYFEEQSIMLLMFLVMIVLSIETVWYLCYDINFTLFSYSLEHCGHLQLIKTRHLRLQI